MIIFLFIFLVILAYLMGSICSAVIVCKACSLPDPRTEGSKNPGATNVLRIAGKKYAALVMVADLLKGLIPVLIARLLDADLITVGFTVLAAVLGHMYPVFFEFKGGKGVATAIGALLGLEFIVGVMVAATWLLVARFTRYSSLASLISICLAPIYSLIILQHQDVFLPLFIMAIMIIYKHRNNINRLIDGKEPKIKIKANLIKDIEEIMEADTPITHPAGAKQKTAVVRKEKSAVKTKAKATKAKAKTTVKAPAKKAAAAKEPVKKEPAKKEPSKKAKPVKKAAAKTNSKKPKEK